MKVLLVGATGLVGAELLELLLRNSKVTEVETLTRRPILKVHEKLNQKVINFKNVDDHNLYNDVDTVFCCLGTTISDAGSREVFKNVDFAIVTKLAKAAKEKGVRRFLYISSIGASKSSPFFYLKTKGEVEQALRHLGFEHLVILRPSLLLGIRARKRRGEELAQKWMPKISFLLPPHRRPIKAKDVAKSMIELCFDKSVSSHLQYEVFRT
ncbi:MAG: NAD(P)H-binding protein [Bdellovibrionales bacterium]|jgi:uncharacterized protein YbjT (DUF2867 family)|nr:NAD(P)H-binding protein [Bdellovibrionales bacterium]